MEHTSQLSALKPILALLSTAQPQVFKVSLRFGRAFDKFEEQFKATEHVRINILEDQTAIETTPYPSRLSRSSETPVGSLSAEFSREC